MSSGEEGEEEELEQVFAVSLLSRTIPVVSGIPQIICPISSVDIEALSC